MTGPTRFCSEFRPKYPVKYGCKVTAMPVPPRDPNGVTNGIDNPYTGRVCVVDVPDVETASVYKEYVVGESRAVVRIAVAQKHHDPNCPCRTETR